MSVGHEGNDSLGQTEEVARSSCGRLPPRVGVHRRDTAASAVLESPGPRGVGALELGTHRWISRRSGGALHHPRFVLAAEIAIAGTDFGSWKLRAAHRAQDPGARSATARTVGWGRRLTHAGGVLERAVVATLVFVERHYSAFARSGPLTIFVGPLAFGLMSKAKISVGNASVAHAFGMSTIPLMRPSIGAVPKIA
jgi:hypothetical protein